MFLGTYDGIKGGYDRVFCKVRCRECEVVLRKVLFVFLFVCLFVFNLDTLSFEIVVYA